MCIRDSSPATWRPSSSSARTRRPRPTCSRSARCCSRCCPASDLLENLLEAFEDDRWEIADREEVIQAAGLSQTDSNVDEATEDLLASLGSKPGAVQVTPIRPAMDLRAAASAAHHTQ